MRIQRKVIKQIPLVTYELENDLDKPLVFFFHGFTGNKDVLMGRGEKLAELGFYVVAVDAHLHGERMAPWFANISNEEKYQHIIDIEMQTAKDAKMLWENVFSKQKGIKHDCFYAYGVSMGSGITFYLSTITDELKAAVTLVGSPSFIEYYKERQKRFKWSDEIVVDRLHEYENHDPLRNSERLKNTLIFLALGEKDEVVYPKFSQELHKKLPETTILKMYDTGHESTPEMLNDSYEFLKKNI
ncbi:alpha/beta hydrolase family protein [Haploplasma axanthum]|uniref:Esterase n=1 Tax=Haploplasma axanthum TaxID=29552 RepID=A0A449BBH3_HAPAX|nr:alpha/beta fold hydrolase [Haploplasma axanthum]VEU79761.1 esterase [Haploplasma axanthum]